MPGGTTAARTSVDAEFGDLVREIALGLVGLGGRHAGRFDALYRDAE